MSRVGLDWYKREPVAYLGDVQGLSSKQHAVYSVVVDLLYVHGGEIKNDPGWIAGWISDMGAAAVRRALADLDANPDITIVISDTHISQKRAKSEAKTKRNQSETNSVSGKKGGEKSAEIRAARKETNNLSEATASIEIQAEKRREEKSIKEEPNGSSKSLSKPDLFQAFWDQFPHRNGKKTKRPQCEAKFRKATREGADPNAILAAAQGYRDDPDVQRGYGRAAEAWLNQRGWEDEAAPPQENFHDKVSEALKGPDHDQLRDPDEAGDQQVERLPAPVPTAGADGRADPPGAPQSDGRSGQQSYLDFIKPRRFGGAC